MPVLEIKDVAQLVARFKDRVNVVLGVCRTDAEPHTRRDKWGRGVRDDNDNYRRLPNAHHPCKSGHFTRVVDQKGNDGGEWVTIGDEAKLLEAHVEVPRIESQAADAHASLRAVCESGRKRYP